MSMVGKWNEAEFASIFPEHYQQILRVARRVVGSSAEAEEVYAEVFWRLYRAGLAKSFYGQFDAGGMIDCLAIFRRRPGYRQVVNAGWGSARYRPGTTATAHDHSQGNQHHQSTQGFRPPCSPRQNKACQ